MNMQNAPFRPAETQFDWCAQIFGAKSVERGGIVRRSVRDVEREIGRGRLIAEVQARGFHLVECGGQFLIICNGGQLRVHV